MPPNPPPPAAVLHLCRPQQLDHLVALRLADLCGRPGLDPRLLAALDQIKKSQALITRARALMSA